MKSYKGRETGTDPEPIKQTSLSATLTPTQVEALFGEQTPVVGERFNLELKVRTVDSDGSIVVENCYHEDKQKEKDSPNVGYDREVLLSSKNLPTPPPINLREFI